jgi:hypothetical protein
MNGKVAQEIADSTIARWQGGELPDTLTVFRSHPEIDWPSTVVCELAYEEYVLRKERGETIDRARFVSRFGERADSVARLLEVDSALSGIEFPVEGADAKAAPVDFPQLGDWIDDALLVDRLGSGSVGRVYLASRKEMGGKQFAVKVSFRLPQEADLLGRVNHPGIMPIHTSPLMRRAASVASSCRFVVGRRCTTCCDGPSTAKTPHAPARWSARWLAMPSSRETW